MDEPLISLCMIVKNEETTLGRALASVKGAVDEIIIGDTGSTDKTLDIAASFGAKTLRLTWEDSFAKARNQVLEQARGDWVLQLDADEELMPGEAGKLRGLTSTNGILAYKLPIIDTHAIMTNTSLTRFFRNRPDIRYTHRIHEHPAFVRPVGAREVAQPAADLEELTQTADVKIIHHGYSESSVAEGAKVERNLKLLMLGLKEAPDDIVYLYHTGQELAALGDFDKALPLLLKAFEHPSSTGMPIIGRNLALSLLYAGRFEEAVSATKKVSAMFPTWAEPVFLAGVASFLLRDLDQADTLLNAARSLKDDPRFPSSPHIADLLPALFLELSSSARQAGRFLIGPNFPAIKLGRSQPAIMLAVSLLATVFPPEIIEDALKPILDNADPAVRALIDHMTGKDDK